MASVNVVMDPLESLKELVQIIDQAFVNATIDSLPQLMTLGCELEKKFEGSLELVRNPGAYTRLTKENFNDQIGTNCMVIDTCGCAGVHKDLCAFPEVNIDLFVRGQDKCSVRAQLNALKTPNHSASSIGYEFKMLYLLVLDSKDVSNRFQVTFKDREKACIEFAKLRGDCEPFCATSMVLCL
jgi:hypothetical protein